MLAANSVPNAIGHMAGWIVDPSGPDPALTTGRWELADPAPTDAVPPGSAPATSSQSAVGQTGTRLGTASPSSHQICSRTRGASDAPDASLSRW